ncbi:hypothetical protein HZR84_08240 [Hyphobacterium sp. CCMP332]|nr:hypothetical protein HZR84_08240 [Hyphobacterium sp. CCMP332]
MNLFEKNDEKGIIDMSEEILHIETAKKKYDIPIFEIHSIQFVYNKSILWLVMGGIIASLSGVGFIKNIINPWESLIYIVFGVLLFYYGWQGRSMLQIVHGLHKKIVISVDDNEKRWYNFIAVFREFRARY